MPTRGGPCIKKVEIENCQVPNPQDQTTCLICVYGYFPEGEKCKKVSPLCRQHNVENGHCTSCLNPGFTVQNGKCLDENCLNPDEDRCLECKHNFVYNYDDKICEFRAPQQEPIPPQTENN